MVCWPGWFAEADEGVFGHKLEVKEQDRQKTRESNLSRGRCKYKCLEKRLGSVRPLRPETRKQRRHRRER